MYYEWVGERGAEGAKLRGDESDYGLVVHQEGMIGAMSDSKRWGRC